MGNKERQPEERTRRQPEEVPPIDRRGPDPRDIRSVTTSPEAGEASADHTFGGSD